MDEEAISSERVEWRQERAGSPTDAIIEAAAEYDLLVVGESEPSLTDRILGDVTDVLITQWCLKSQGTGENQLTSG